MNGKNLGFYSGVILAITIIVFGISMIVGTPMLSYFICMILSWSYVALTCALASNVKKEKHAYAYAGIAFACIYSAIISVVYYTQLTVVNQNSISAEALKILTYTPGSFMFALDLLGYGILAISTLFVGLSLTANNKADKVLKVMLIIHGIFISCIIFPMTNIFSATATQTSGIDIGVIVLEFWCLYFTPIALLAANYFRKNSESV